LQEIFERASLVEAGAQQARLEAIEAKTRAQEEIAAMEQEVEQTKGLQNELNSTLLHELESTTEALASSRHDLETRPHLDQLQSLQQSLEKARHELEEARSELDRCREKARHELEEARSELDRCREEARRLESAVDRERYENETKEKQSAAAAVVHQETVEQLGAELRLQQAQMATMERELSSLPLPAYGLEARLAEMEARALEGEDMIAMREWRVQEITAQCVEDLKELEEEASRLREENARAEEQTAALQDQVTEQSAMLEDMAAAADRLATSSEREAENLRRERDEVVGELASARAAQSRLGEENAFLQGRGDRQGSPPVSPSGIGVEGKKEAASPTVSPPGPSPTLASPESQKAALLEIEHLRRELGGSREEEGKLKAQLARAYHLLAFQEDQEEEDEEEGEWGVNSRPFSPSTDKEDAVPPPELDEEVPDASNPEAAAWRREAERLDGDVDRLAAELEATREACRVAEAELAELAARLLTTESSSAGGADEHRHPLYGKNLALPGSPSTVGGGLSPAQRRRKRRAGKRSPEKDANSECLDGALREVERWRREASERGIECEAARAQATQAAELMDRRAAHDADRAVYEDELEAQVEELNQRLRERQKETPAVSYELPGRALLASLEAGAGACLLWCFFTAASRRATERGLARWRAGSMEALYQLDVKEAFQQAAATALLTRIVLGFKTRVVVKSLVRWRTRSAAVVSLGEIAQLRRARAGIVNSVYYWYRVRPRGAGRPTPRRRRRNRARRRRRALRTRHRTRRCRCRGRCWKK